MALKVLIPFPTTYKCESVFSTLLAIKSITHLFKKGTALIAKEEVHPSH